MSIRSAQIARLVFEGVTNGELSRNMVERILDDFEMGSIDDALATRDAIKEDKPAPYEAQVPDDDKPHLNPEFGRLTRKPRKGKRGYIWIRPGKDKNGNVVKRGYWVKKSKLTRGRTGRPKSPETTTPENIDAVRQRKLERDRAYYHARKKAGKTKPRVRHDLHVREMTSEQVMAKREAARLGYYRARAKKKGWPIPQTEAEGIAQNKFTMTRQPVPAPAAPSASSAPDFESMTKEQQTKAAAARLYQPHKRAKAKFVRKKKA